MTRSDDDIENDVKAALLEDPATESYEISVNVDDGHVFLTGTTQSWKERELCATVAKGIKGVMDVTADLEVTYTSDRPDFEIKNEIEQTLRWDVLVDDALIDVNVDNGNVRLSGTVGSAAEKRQARYDAWTSGVKSVDDAGLNVEIWARDEKLRKDKYVSVTDEEIRQAVEAALLHDPRVMSFNVEPSVFTGIVTLRGEVDNLKAKRAAKQDAKHTVGVISVNDYLKVRPPVQRSDEKIETEIENALLRDSYLDRYEISVVVYDGTAYLTGNVDTYYGKAHADDLASRVNGVVRVVNNLEVDDHLYPYDPWVDEWDIYSYDWYRYHPTYSFRSDWEIERDIENELWWSPFVDADEVNVEVDDGVATLTGTVDSWMEKGAARDNAYEAGATFVRNQLEIRSR